MISKQLDENFSNQLLVNNFLSLMPFCIITHEELIAVTVLQNQQQKQRKKRFLLIKVLDCCNLIKVFNLSIYK